MELLPLIRRSAALVAILVATTTGLPAPAGERPVSVRKISLATVASGTQVDIAFDGAVGAANLFSLSGPDRVVLDLTSVVLDTRTAALPAATGVVHRLRSGPRDGGVRLVFDVDAQTLARRVDAPSGHLVIVLASAAKAASVSAAATGSLAEPPVSLAERVADIPTPLETPPPTKVAVTRPNSGNGQARGRVLTIAVDAGHGGEDPGASGPDGTREKDVTLAIARELAARINAEPGMRATLTRPDDHFVPLRERIHRARRAQADLFVSVHADAVPDHSVSGASVYVLSARGATNEAAKWLADRENAADLVGGVSLDDKDTVLASVLLDLSQSAAMSASMVAAEKVLNELNTVGDVRKARVQQAGFVVLRSPDIPSMLIETAYITNPGEEKRLRDERYQQKLASAILAGIRTYFRESPLPGTRLASVSSDSPETRSR